MTTPSPFGSYEPPPRANDLPTVCVLCSQNCGLRVDVEEGAITKVRADEENPITRGYICNKAATIDRYVRHDGRLTSPLERQKDGSFAEVSWDHAIKRIAERLAAVKRDHGGRAIALVGVGGQANHMEAAYALGLLNGLGSRRWFNAYAQEKTQNQLVDNWIAEASPAVVLHADTERCRYLLVLGTNPRVSNRGHAANETFRTIVSDPNRRLVVVDPRVTETTRGADRHLRVRPGMDVYLLLAWSAFIVQENLHHQTFLKDHCADADVIVNLLRELSAADLCRRAGLDPEVVKDEAARFARADGAAVLWDLGIEHGRFSTLAAYLLRLVLIVTGNYGKVGGNIFLEAFSPPGAGKSRREPERALASGIAGIRALGNFEMFSPTLFPEEVLIDHPERIRAAIVTSSNPLASFSDTPKWREAFHKLDLSVVIDPAMTETARAADYVLPVPSGYEKWEVSGFPKGHPDLMTQVRPPVLPPLQGTLPEPEIFARIAEAMKLFGEPPLPLTLIARGAGTDLGRSAATAALLAAASIAGKRRGNGVQNHVLFWGYRLLGPHLTAPSLTAIWLLCVQNALARREAVMAAYEPKGLFDKTPFGLASAMYRNIMEHPEGALVAKLPLGDNLARNVGYRDKLLRVSPALMMAEIARALAAPEDTSPEYPLVLAAGVRTHWTANTIQRDPSWRKGKGPHCALSMAAEDARALGLNDGDRAALVTRSGEAVLPVAVDPRLPQGFVTVPNGFGLSLGEGGAPDGVNLNELTRGVDRDAITGCPQHKHVPCRVERRAAT